MSAFPYSFIIILDKIVIDDLEDHDGSVRIGGRSITNLPSADDTHSLIGKEEERI